MSAEYEAINNTYGTSTTFAAQATFSTPQPGGDPVTPPAGGGSGGGCNAGFATAGLFVLALFSLFGFRRIRKEKQSKNVN
jgi:hypothetical protein